MKLDYTLQDKLNAEMLLRYAATYQKMVTFGVPKTILEDSLTNILAATCNAIESQKNDLNYSRFENMISDETIKKNAEPMKVRLSDADNSTLIELESLVYREFEHRADRFMKYMEIVREDEELERLHEEAGIISLEQKRDEKFIKNEVNLMLKEMGIEDEL